jgi:cytochrome b561
VAREDKADRLAGLELPALIGGDRPLVAQLGDIHSFPGYSLLILIGLHAGAALFHHFIHCGVLDAMLPARLRGAAAYHAKRGRPL